MKAVGFTLSGMEQVAAGEVKEITGSEPRADKRLVFFDCTEQELCRLCYISQSFIRIMALLNTCSNDKECLASSIQETDLSKWLCNRTFAARAIVLCNDNDRTELEAFVGEQVVKKTRARVDLDNPDIIFYCISAENYFYFCLDFSGADLGKRDYRIFNHPAALKASIAYSMLRFSGLRQGENLLDPFCGSSTIAIEAAHFLSRMPVNYFTKDKFAFLRFREFDFEKEDSRISDAKLNIYSFDSQMRHIKASEKNAKISGVNKLINFSRTEVDWLDTKFGKGSINRIVTNPPQLSKNISRKELQGLYDEFFYQAGYVLHKKGSITLISTEGRINNMLLSSAERYKFSLKEIKRVIHGKQEEQILIFIPDP